METKKITIILSILIGIFMISGAMGYSLFPRPIVNNTFFPNQAFAFEFNFTLNNGTVLLSNSSTLTTDASGVAFTNILIDFSQVPERFIHSRNGTIIVNQSFDDKIFNKIYVNDSLFNKITVNELILNNGINLSAINDTFFRLDGTSVMQGNTNQGGFNITNVSSINVSTILGNPNINIGSPVEFGANNFNGSGNFTTLGNVSAGFYIGDGSQLTNIPHFNATYDAKADYQFTTNNFNGSGTFTTTSTITAEQLTSTDDATITDLLTAGRIIVDQITINSNTISTSGGTDLTLSPAGGDIQIGNNNILGGTGRIELLTGEGFFNSVIIGGTEGRIESSFGVDLVLLSGDGQIQIQQSDLAFINNNGITGLKNIFMNGVVDFGINTILDESMTGNWQHNNDSITNLSSIFSGEGLWNITSAGLFQGDGSTLTGIIHDINGTDINILSLNASSINTTDLTVGDGTSNFMTINFNGLSKDASLVMNTLTNPARLELGTEDLYLRTGHIGQGSIGSPSPIALFQQLELSGDANLQGMNFLIIGNPTGGSGFSYSGMNGAVSFQGSVAVNDVAGGFLQALQGSSGDVDRLAGLFVSTTLTGSGNTNTKHGLKIFHITPTGSGTVTDNFGLEIDAIDDGTATYTNNYGLKIGDITGGTNFNHALWTGEGSVLFGDNVTILDYLNVTDVGFFDRLVLGQHNESVNSSFGDISSGDIVGQNAYFNAYFGRSILAFCDPNDWTCEFKIPTHQKTLWAKFDEGWIINTIYYEDNNYTKQEFNSLVCSQNQKTQDICNKLNSKVLTLQTDYQNNIISKQEREAKEQAKIIRLGIIETCHNSGYNWDDECYEVIKIQTDYNGAVESYNKPIMEYYECIILDNSFQEINSACLREGQQTEIRYRFKKDCDWDVDNGYYCQVRELR